MGDNVIHITDLGMQASFNAKEGGVHVSVVYFKLGDSDAVHLDTDTDIRGNTLHQAQIHLIEVLNRSTARFTFEIPAHAVPEGGMLAKEVGLYMDDNIMFGRCVFSEPYNLIAGRATRIHALLITTRVDVSVINVTMADLSSIPSASNVYRLPPPETSLYNALSVLDAQENLDGTSSPTLAYKFGSGSLQWGFAGYERVFSGMPDAGAVPTEFQQTALTTSLNFRNGETVIVYAVSGLSRGQSRKFYYASGSNSFIEKDGEPMLNLDNTSTLVVWRKLSNGGSSGAEYPPPMTGIPHDWVLTRGVGGLPVWAPPKNTGKNLNTLYMSPGRLRITVMNEVGTGQTSRYSLGGMLVKDVNHCFTALGGVTQHKSAFDVSSSEIEYAENVPPHAAVDIRLLTKEPGTGTFIEMYTDEHVGDGATRRFKTSKSIENADYAFVYIRGAMQSTTAYTYDASTQEIVFVSAPAEGLDIEISSIVPRQEEGYSTTVYSTTVITVGETLFIELPVEPQSKDHTFLSVSGTHIHRSKYTVVDNKIVLSSPVRGGLSVEASVLHNVLSQGTPQTNLKGVVTDAVLTSKALKLLRHDAHPVVLPIPAVELTSGNGIRISGQHPNYKIESTLAEKFTDTTSFKFSTLRRQDDSEEIIYTHRINIERDVMLEVTADFASMLGPGFVSPEGMEIMEYVIGFRTTSAKEPDYGRNIKGTGIAGFSSLVGSSNERAYSNASLTQVYEVIKSNIPAGYIDVVARMRVRHASISKYGSQLSINFNLVGTPILT